jgi:2-dehydropantoate 2-reductase
VTAPPTAATPPPVHVVGAGGIGCAVGYALCAAGVPVTFVDADPEKVAWGRAHGVALDRRPPRPARFELFAEWQPPADAVALLCTKCYDNAAVLARLPASAAVLPVQNGFDRALNGREGDIAGIVSFVAECLPRRTHARITRRGRVHVGPGVRPVAAPRGDGPDPRQAAVVEALARHAPFRVDLVPDILPYKYTKLLYNAAISPVATAAGLDNGQLLSVPAARRVFFALLEENYRILRGAGVLLGVVGPFHPDTVQRILHRPAVARVLAWVLYPTLRGTHCSMFADLPAGRTEIDYYNGHLIELAGDRPCPFNRRVHALIKRMERDRITPHPGALDELAHGGC